MVIRNVILLVVVLIIIMQFSACDPPEGPSYTFSVTATIYPTDRDTINIGDTLYLVSTFSTQLKDIRTGKLVDYSYYTNIGGTLGFGDFLTMQSNPTQDSTTTKYFDYVKIDGDVYNDKQAPVYWSVNQTRYEEKNNTYSLKIGMIPKKKGMFAFSISDLYSNGKAGNNRASFAMKFVNTDQHLHYFEDKFGQLSEHDAGQVYCFVVE